MKITLVLLIVTLVVLAANSQQYRRPTSWRSQQSSPSSSWRSYFQRPIYPYHPYRFNQDPSNAHLLDDDLLPFPYNYKNIAPHQFDSVYQGNEGYDDGFGDNGHTDSDETEFRRPVSNDNNDKQRLFQGGLGAQGVNNNNAAALFTVTSYIVVSTQVTSTSLCIAATLFSPSKSTVRCRRKKRQDAELLDMLFDPSVPNNPFVTSTAAPASIEEYRQERDVVAHDSPSDQLVSSKHEDGDVVQAPLTRQMRQLFPRLVTTKVLTLFSINTTTVSSTYTTNFASASALSCLPAGYTYC